MSKHTPGPWTIQSPFCIGNDKQVFINAHDCVCVVKKYADSHGISQANAQLIAAAPELLNALQGLVNDVKNKPNDTRYATHIKIAEAAIKKATE